MQNNLSTIKIEGPFWKADAEIVNVVTPPPVAPIVLYSDRFGNYSENRQLSEWRETTPGFSMERADDYFRVIRYSKDLFFGMTQGKKNVHVHTHLDSEAATNWTNYTFSGVFAVGRRLQNKGGLTFFSQYREGGKDRYYRFSNQGSEETFVLNKRVDGRETRLADSSLIMSKGTQYQFEIEVLDTGGGTHIRIKVWEQSGPEPSEYLIDVTDSDPDRLTSGTIGIWTSGYGGKYFNDFKVVGYGPLDYRAIKNIFIDHPSLTTNFPGRSLFFPGTKIAICKVHRLEMDLFGGAQGPLVWLKEGKEEDGSLVEAERLKEKITSGELSLLVLRTLHSDLETPDTYRCLNGYINLDVLQAAAQARAEVFRALGLEERPSRTSQGKENLPGFLSANSSGLSIFGGITLPWLAQDSTLDAPFQLFRLFPEPEEKAVYHLNLDEERFTAEEKRAWIEAWQQLSVYINPKYPQNPLEAILQERPVPVWATVELANIFNIPQLYWRYEAGEQGFAQARLIFEQGAIHLFLSDQFLYDEENASETVVQITPKVVQITPGADDRLTIEINPESEQDPGAEDSLTGVQYSAKLENESWIESFTGRNLELVYDAVEVPRQIRDAQELPTPEWSPPLSPDETSNAALVPAEPIEQALVWGFMPLENGWAQLPVVNLNEQIYIDADLAQEFKSDQSGRNESFRGAISLSNDSQSGSSNKPPLEQPWDLTLFNTGEFRGTLKLKPETNGFRMQELNLIFKQPEIALNGLLWLSAGKPTTEDAIPDLDNWVNGLYPVTLRTYHESKTIFPAAMSFALEELSIVPQKNQQADQQVQALLGSWSFRYQAREAFVNKLIEMDILPPNPFSNHLPILWLHDPALPFVQALPLTQTQSPPNYPSASRQYAPFTFRVPEDDHDTVFFPGNWTFVSAEDNGAGAWLRPIDEIKPLGEWEGRTDLPMTSLSLPGMVLTPNGGINLNGAENPATTLGMQFRLDVPYTDEVNALAQLPKEPQNKEELTPLPDAPPPALPQPLSRESLETHWEQLSNQANLARADAIDLLAAQDQKIVAKNLVEPFVWEIKLQTDLTEYPGRISLSNADGNQSIDLEKEKALKGISGHFKETDTGFIQLDAATEDSFEIVAHSMAAWKDQPEQLMRDQRGLYRGASLKVGPEAAKTMIQTRIGLEESTKMYRLSTLLNSLELEVGGSDPWIFWFKDLPLEEGEDKEVFTRLTTRSEEAKDKDVNDPESLSRAYNSLQGYEWRLGVKNDSVPDRSFLNLLGLHFFPLTLEEVHYQNEQCSKVAITGRLQLPIGRREAQEELNNAVRLTFTKPTGTSAKLTLADVQAVEGDIEWPIDDYSVGSGEAPRLYWDVIQLENRQGELSLVLEKPRLGFLLFDANWQIALADLDLSNGISSGAFPLETHGMGLWPDVCDLNLDLQPNPEDGQYYFEHTLEVFFKLKLGDRARAAFQANIGFLLTGAEKGTVRIVSGKLFEVLTIAGPAESGDASFLASVSYTNLALQFHWDQLLDQGKYYLLPGISLLPKEGIKNPGFATLTFETDAIQKDFPELKLKSAFVEALLVCEWSQFLQDPNPLSSQSVFDACAGTMTIGYTAEYRQKEALWHDSLLLNGFLEVKNLLSWPADMHFDAENYQVTIPNGNDPREQDFRHIRHSIRILFNQHQIPSNILEAVPGEDLSNHLLFTIREGFSWQFLAVTEHQIIEVNAGDVLSSKPGSKPPKQRRWTALQEIRLFSPQRFKNFLEFILGKELSGRSDRTRLESTYEPLDLDNLPAEVSIRGRVVNKVGRGIPGVEVQLYYGSTGVPKPMAGIEAVISEIDGRFAFEQLPIRSVMTPDGTGSVKFRVYFGRKTYLSARNSPAWSSEIGSGEIILTIDMDAQTLKYFPPHFLQSVATAIDHLEEDILFVEASSPHWIKQEPLEKAGFTTLQYLPNGQQSAVLSNLNDFGVSDPKDPQWQLMLTPFIGRLQQNSADYYGLDQSLPDANKVFQVDPVINLYLHAQQADVSPSYLTLGFTSWANEPDYQLAISPLDLSAANRWSELDPQSLQENFFRLLHPPEESDADFLQSVTASRPDSAAALSRGPAMTQAFVGTRRAYPPELLSPMTIPAYGRTGNLLWREGGLISLELSSKEDPTNDGALIWWAHGLVLGEWLNRTFAEKEAQSVLRFPSATPLPTPDTESISNSFAISPYLGLNFTGSELERKLVLVSSELLCLDVSEGALRPVASRFWEIKPDLEGGITADNVFVLITEWAVETHAKISPNSPLAVLRLRQIERAVGQSASLITSYSFLSLDTLEKQTLVRQAFNLRADNIELRFTEGQFNGFRMPADPKDFELAPPQVTGVQPIHINKEGNGEEALDQLAEKLPWGLSTLQITSQITEQKKAVIGQLQQPGKDLPSLHLWWQALPHFVQYRSAEDERPRAGLPRNFRAKAIRSLLPALPDIPLPQESMHKFIKAGEEENSSINRNWQPILPGAVQILPIHSRPGVPFVFRYHLQRQSAGLSQNDHGQQGADESLVSGSVPVQHRFPRPVSLPSNRPDAKEKALQCWAGYFQPEKNLYFETNPRDEAFFADCGSQPARSIALTMTTPAYGALSSEWNGTIEFKVETQPEPFELSDWPLFVHLDSGSQPINNWEVTMSGDKLKVALPDPAALQSLLNTINPGEQLFLAIRVRHVEGNPGFFQTLRFPMRFTEDAPTKLPLEPYFIHFEDPEYNRALASSSASATRSFKAGSNIATVRLSTDRKIYNPDSRIAFRFDWLDPKAIKVQAKDTSFNPASVDLPAGLQIETIAESPGNKYDLGISWVGTLVHNRDLIALKALRNQSGNDQAFKKAMDGLLRLIQEEELLSEYGAVQLRFKRIDPDSGVGEVFATLPDDQPDLGELRPGKLQQVSIAELLQSNADAISSGDTLQLELIIPLREGGGTVPISTILDLDIVSDPVVPVTESAYALLRARRKTGKLRVDCPRFAWSPKAGRIELVCPDDLLTEIVRRRAVFQWTDTNRSGSAVQYGVQKITQNGSTHFIDFG